MPRWNPHRRVEAAATSPGVDNIHEYLARNLSDGYRLAAMVLDDPIEAGAVLRGTTMSAWLSASDASPEAVDESFRRRFDSELQAVVRSRQSSEGMDVVVLGPLEAAIAGLGPRLQIGLASGFGPWQGAGPFAGRGPCRCGSYPATRPCPPPATPMPRSGLSTKPAIRESRPHCRCACDSSRIFVRRR